MAPATKYGGKKVLCHPGTIAIVKSKLTTVCTESTSGVASPAGNSVAVSYTLQSRRARRRAPALAPARGQQTRHRPQQQQQQRESHPESGHPEERSLLGQHHGGDLVRNRPKCIPRCDDRWGML